MKICFIGNSGHAIQTYNEMKNCPDAEFVGIAPSCTLEGTNGMEAFNTKIFDDYKKMLDETNPQVAVIAPIFGYIGRIIKECAERKIDVFAEKPIAASAQELESVEFAIQSNGIHFSAMHFLRFTPSFYHAQKKVKSGAIGKINLITAQKSYKYGKRAEWYSDRKLYPGTIPWVGIHAIDWIYFFSEKKFKSVSALSHGNPSRYALCQFELEDDIIASVNVDFLRPVDAPTHGDDRIRIAGTEGVIEVFENKFILINKDGTKEYFPETAPKLAYDFLQHTEELSVEEIFTLTDVALKAQESADSHTKILF